MTEIGKIAAAEAATSYIENGMIVGLGSGTTSSKFIQALSLKVQEGLQIQAISSSRSSSELAKRGGIEILDINSASHIDITVDGADEIDRQKRMIKGGGGAHVREKILANASSDMVVIVDESKVVDRLGLKKLPIEVAFYGAPITKAKIEELGFSTQFRLSETETLFITENGNLILDLEFLAPLESPESLHKMLIDIPGVIDTGFFFHLAKKVIVGFEDGTVEIWH